MGLLQPYRNLVLIFKEVEVKRLIDIRNMPGKYADSPLSIRQELFPSRNQL